jgi:phospholipase/carboxylesterase
VLGGVGTDDAELAVILLHGRNRSPEEMLAWAEKIAVPKIAYLAPKASGASWYPQGFLAPRDENEPHFGDATACIDRIVTDLGERGFPREKIVLVGFSQGACLACQYIWDHPGRWGALVVWTGGLLGPLGSVWDGAVDLKGTPVLMGTSDIDTWVPLERAQETATVFRRAGAEVDFRVYPGMEHIVSDDEIAAARELLRSML